MSQRFVPVPADAIRKLMIECGFKRIEHAGSEEVYQRDHDKDPHYHVRVYSSIPVDANRVRGCGRDAIRVVAGVHRSGLWFCVYRAARTYRTGTVEGVLERTRQRMREAYQAINQRIKQ